MPGFTRRDFVNTSVGMAAAIAATPAYVFGAQDEPREGGNAPPPSEQVNLAVVGFNGRGGQHITDITNIKQANLAALCDVDKKVLARGVKNVEAKTGKTPKDYDDYRRLLDDKSIDAVVIASPNHWHSLQSIWAIQAGKDVYVEKPMSHNIFEGRKVVEFARKHNRIVLHGTQSRSIPKMISAMKFLNDGKLGKVLMARGTCFKNRDSIGKVNGPQPVPEDVNYDLWLGPAPMKPPMREQFHYDWHWFWDYGNGDIGNQGVHQIDVAMWGLNKKEHPRYVQALGGRFGWDDNGETPNTQLAVIEWADGTQLLFEVRDMKSKPIAGTKNNITDVFYCSEGTLVCNGYDPVAYHPNGDKIEIPAVARGSGLHMVSFLRALKTRELAYERGESECGHMSCVPAHMANISYRLGKEVPFNQEKHAFGDDKALMATFDRTCEYLKQNKVAIDGANYILGPRLEFDGKSERFVNNPDADKLLTREYREPYVVPTTVA